MSQSQIPIQDARSATQETDLDALIIEDEPFYGALLERIVRGIVPEGWDVRRLLKGTAATYVLILDPDIKLVVLDHLLPDKLGIEVAEEAVAVRPHLRGRIIVSSGSRFDRDLQERYDAAGCITLEKPYDIADLEKLILKIIGTPIS